MARRTAGQLLVIKREEVAAGRRGTVGAARAGVGRVCLAEGGNACALADGERRRLAARGGAAPQG